MYQPTDRSKIKRVPMRGHYDQETIYSIIDEALICHVGFVQAGQPFVIPTIHARDGDSIILHGANASRLLKQQGVPLCITITHVDGLVLARSVFHHSMNYRSVVLFGEGQVITARDEIIEAMRILTEHIMPGRWDDARQPTDKEINATTMVRVPIDDASAKIRTGAPKDDAEDYALDIWAGVVPMQTHFGDPQPDNDLPLPAYVSHYQRGG